MRGRLHLFTLQIPRERSHNYSIGIVMITAEEEKYILTHAYIPEHLVGLMTRVSGGEPFLVDDYFYCRKGDWIIIVGYPLQHDFIINEFETVFNNLKKKYRPKYVSLVAPELPLSVTDSCRERESDYYYTLDIENITISSRLKRLVNKTLKSLKIEHSNHFRKDNSELSLEFIERVDPSPRVKELLLKMPEYVSHSSNSIVLNAWDYKDNLTAFYIVDLWAKNFSTYVIGCHSKKNYVSGASDLLFFEMIKKSKECAKNYIHLGLGVNKGIRQFKKKWGGIPSHKYEMCELVTRKPSIFDVFRGMQILNGH